MAFSVLSILNQYWNIVYARPGLEYYYRREPLSMYWEFQVIKSLWVKWLLWGGLCCHNLPNDCVKINECKWACIRPSLPEISLEAVFLWALAVLCHAICIIVRKQGRIFLQQLCCFHKLCVKCASLAGIHTVQNILNQALLLSVPNWAMQKSSAETELSLWDICCIFQAPSHMGKHQDVAVGIHGFQGKSCHVALCTSSECDSSIPVQSRMGLCLA